MRKHRKSRNFVANTPMAKAISEIAQACGVRPSDILLDTAGKYLIDVMVLQSSDEPQSVKEKYEMMKQRVLSKYASSRYYS